MDQPPVDPNMRGQVASEEVVEEPGEIPDPSMAKDPKSEQVPDLSITRDPKGAQVPDSSISQDPKGAQISNHTAAKDSKPKQTPGATTTMVPEPKHVSDPMVTKESVEAATPLVITSIPYLTSSFCLWLM